MATVSPRPLGRDVPVYIPSPTDSGRSNGPAFANVMDSVTLRDALALALLHNPELATFAWETRAREARVLQANRLPNPVVGIDFEDIGGPRLRSGAAGSDQTIQPQTTVRLGQLIELGGKRAARRGRSRDRRHAVGGSGAETRRPVRRCRSRYGYGRGK